MRKTLLLLSLVCCVKAVAAAVIGSPALFQEPVRLTRVEPATAPVDQPVVVTVEATVTASQNLLPNSVTLVRYHQNGDFEANLGPMFDDGTRGDRVANDGIFTAQVTIREAAPRTILLRASLAFRRQLRRTLSPSATFTIIGTLPLQVQITKPTAGAIFKSQPVVVEGTVTNATSQTAVTVNGINATLTNGQFKAEVPLAREGIHTITAIALNSGGGASQSSVDIVYDSLPPTLAVDTPANGANLFSTPAIINGRATDTGSGVVSVTCKGVAATLNGQNFSCNVALTPGANAINIVATDVAGNAATATLSLAYTTVPSITLTSPTNLGFLNITPTTVTGKVDDPTAKVTVNSVEAAVVNGSFSVALPLLEGPNTITASATSANGAVGTASLVVTLDTTPPRVTITSPTNQFVTTDAAISIAGSVNDIVVGTVNAQQAQVTVNGVAAQVANRTFLAPNIPLQMGNNVIQAVGRDRTGNTTTTQITVIRQAATQAQIRALSGNNQTAAIGTQLPAPLVVVVTDASGNPVPNKQVIFKATQNDGMVSTGGAFAPTVIATTNAQGQAQAQWKLGMRAGAGGNCVEAYVVGFMGTAIFSATGTQGPAGKIVIDTGNDQIGNINQLLPKPLIAVVVDAGNNRLANVPVTFTVKEGGGNFGGQATFTVNSDSDGRVAANLTLGMQEGNANNLVEANFSSNTGFPASFTASGRAPGNPTNTTITGVILDNSNVPIPGVTVRAVLTNLLTSNSNIIQSLPAVQTNAQGQFTIPQAPVGFVKLLVDGSTATRPGKYPTLDYDLVTVAGQNNRLSMPVFLLPLNTSNQLCVTETTGGGTLTVPEAPGFSLTFGPGQVIFPGGSKTGCISVTVVHSDKVPMSPGFGQQPRFIVTIQPSGAVFTIPATITLPNVDGFRPRAVTEMYSFDHDIGSFVAIGTATVSEDGLVIRSNPGVGVLKAGWHCGGDPNSQGSSASLQVSFDNNLIKMQYGSSNEVVANGSPPLDGQYLNWAIKDSTFDVKVAFGSQPSCPDSQSCKNTLVAPQFALPASNRLNICGTATASVDFKCTTTGQTVTGMAKIELGCGGRSAAECLNVCNSEPALGMCGTPCSLKGITPPAFNPNQPGSCWKVNVGGTDYCYWDYKAIGGAGFENLCCANRCSGGSFTVWGQGPGEYVCTVIEKCESNPAFRGGRCVEIH